LDVDAAKVTFALADNWVDDAKVNISDWVFFYA
jgi:hypothetical protein